MKKKIIDIMSIFDMESKNKYSKNFVSL